MIHRHFDALIGPKALVVAVFLLLAGPLASAAPSPSAPPSAGARPDQLAVLYRTLLAADRVGLDPADYLTPALDRLLSSGVSDAATAQLLAAAARYAGDLRRGRMPLASFRRDWAMRPPAFEARTELEAALAADRLEAWLAELAPSHPGYLRLAAEAVRYNQIVAQGGWPSLDATKPLKLGSSADGVQALRRRLQAEGADFVEPADPRVFDAGLKAAVATYQTTHGLTGTGEANRATLQALNIRAEDRLATLRANLERWRWAPRTLPATRVEVNVAAAELQVYDAGRRTIAMRTVVGRRADPTPMFADTIEAVVFNPPWNVPDGIASREILPKAATDPGYLAREQYIWINQGGQRRLQQKAGPKSALGRFKFDMLNSFSVYLHDTPNHAVFAQGARALSHGCVRLDEPRALAQWLLGQQGWDAARIDAAVAAGATARVTLDKPVPVYLFYFTAYVADDGALNFRDDVYGWDRLATQVARSSPAGVLSAQPSECFGGAASQPG